MNDIAFYVHIPFCPSGCRFCHFYLEGEKKLGYIDLLKKEYFLRFQNKILEVSSIHIGGGTPNMLSLNELRDLLGFLSENLFGYEEFSIELHPSLLSYELFDILFEKGVNRVSFGIQTLDSKILLHHTRVDINYQDLEKYILYARKIGIKKINFDFIYDLIGDSLQNINTTLAFIEQLRPSSIYYYRLRKFTPYLQEHHTSNEKRAFYYYLHIKNTMGGMGYKRLNNAVYYDEKQLEGMPPFLYDEVIYSRRRTLIGLGVAATSDAENIYKKNTIDYSIYRERILNDVLPFDLEFSLQQETFYISKLYFYFLQNETFSKKDFEDLYGRSETIEKLFVHMQNLGFIEILHTIISLTEKGHYYLDDKLGEIFFSGRSNELELLKKL